MEKHHSHGSFCCVSSFTFLYAEIVVVKDAASSAQEIPMDFDANLSDQSNTLNESALSRHELQPSIVGKDVIGIQKTEAELSNSGAMLSTTEVDSSFSISVASYPVTDLLFDVSSPLKDNLLPDASSAALVNQGDFDLLGVPSEPLDGSNHPFSSRSTRLPVVADALEKAKAHISNFLEDSTIGQKLSSIFDRAAEKEVLGELHNIVFETDPNFPEIKITSSASLQNSAGEYIHGAYIKETNTILISDYFLYNLHELTTDFLVSVLLEEIGHYVDVQTSQQDSSGDEGALFAAAALGISPVAEDVLSLKSENDTTTIEVDGILRSAEQSQIAMTTYRGRIYQSYRDAKHNIFIRSSKNGRRWDNWQQVGGSHFTSYNASDNEAHDGKIYLSHRGLGNQILVGEISVQDLDGSGLVNVSNNRQIPGETVDAVSLKSFKGNFYAVHRGADNEIYFKNLNDNRNWYRVDNSLGNTSTPEAVTIAVHKGQLYLAHRSNQGDMYVSKISRKGALIGKGWHKINGKTNQAISMASHKGELYLTRTGLDGHLYSGIYTSKGVAWEKQKRLTEGESSLESFRKKIYESHHSKEGHIYTYASANRTIDRAWKRTNKDTSVSTPLDFESPTSDNDWSVKYYNNKSLEGKPVLRENFSNGLIEKSGRKSNSGKETPNFYINLGLDSPGKGIKSDNFSARYTKKHDLEKGLYKIQTKSDDGVAVSIDGKQVVNRWFDQGETAFAGYFYSDGGAHDIEMRYYDATGGSVSGIEFEKVSDPYNRLKSRQLDVKKKWHGILFHVDQNTVPSTDFHSGDFDNNRAISFVDLGRNSREDGKKGISANWSIGAVNGNNANLPHDNFAIRAYTVDNF